MAIDSKNELFSMMNFGEGDVLLPDPDGANDAGDRAHLLGLYAGIALTVVAVFRSGWTALSGLSGLNAGGPF